MVFVFIPKISILLAGTTAQPNDKIKKVRDEYERKLTDMQTQLRKLQSAQKEHIRQQRELAAQDNQLRNLKNELYELKSAKVWDFFNVFLDLGRYNCNFFYIY